MKTPDDVTAMLRLKACGWGVKRIARRWVGCSFAGLAKALSVIHIQRMHPAKFPATLGLHRPPKKQGRAPGSHLC